MSSSIVPIKILRPSCQPKFEVISDECRAEGAAIVLTDAPAVVELKREFGALDFQEEALKASLRIPGLPAVLTTEARFELEQTRARKAEIARLIFNKQP
jgi:hypothetical protein